MGCQVGSQVAVTRGIQTCVTVERTQQVREVNENLYRNKDGRQHLMESEGAKRTLKSQANRKGAINDLVLVIGAVGSSLICRQRHVASHGQGGRVGRKS